jgi:hypothetical protein
MLRFSKASSPAVVLRPPLIAKPLAVLNDETPIVFIRVLIDTIVHDPIRHVQDGNPSA